MITELPCTPGYTEVGKCQNPRIIVSELKPWDIYPSIFTELIITFVFVSSRRVSLRIMFSALSDSSILLVPRISCAKTSVLGDICVKRLMEICFVNLYMSKEFFLRTMSLYTGYTKKYTSGTSANSRSVTVIVIFNPLFICSKIVALIYVLYYSRKRRYINFNIGLAWQRKNLNLVYKLRQRIFQIKRIQCSLKWR